MFKKTYGFYQLVHFVFLIQDYQIWLTVFSLCCDDNRGCGNDIWILAHSKSKQTKVNLKTKKKNWLKNQKMSFGPQLPAHLHKPREESDSESDDDQSYGPRLPSVPCRGPKPAQNSG